MTKTTNYQLNQWAKSDRLMMDDFNADNQKIDAAIKTAAQGNCRVAVGSYVGTGAYGEANPNSIACPFRPLFIILDTQSLHGSSYGQQHTIFYYGMENALGCETSSQLALSWDGNTVTWYLTGNNSEPAKRQFNTSGKTYHYIVVGMV